ncbi:MAG TPA: sulfatase-like hydrolase/transferase [Acidobacteriaceae bacterium]|nr:sulfatase-like hydrolase/transferase [Acidobacteriaceae bacterium]
MWKRVLKRICQCIGVSSLILVGNYGDLLGGGADVRMHTPYALGKICAAQIADIALVALVLFVVLSLAARTRFYPWVRLVAAIVIPPYLIQRTQSFFPFDLIEGIVIILLVVWAAILLLLLLRFGLWYRRLLRVGSFIAASLVIFAAGSVAQLIWVATWKPAPNQIVAAWETTAQPPRVHPLLVWVVFDELSYDQVFEHRARDLNMPNFDALRAQSTVFTDTQPAGYHTVKIIPSLLTGRIIDGIRYNFHNRLWVRHEDDGKWSPIDGQQTVFADADKAGWRTAAVGWYNPYCAIYGDAIQNCFWTNHDMFDGMMGQGASLGSNIYTPLAQVVRELKSPARADRDLCTFDVRHRYKTHMDLQQHAFDVLHTDQADFVFFHFSLPHSPNIWSRINDDYTQFCDSSYLDNLALTDRVLGQVMTVLKASPRWKDTNVIVQGDHGWRIDAWNWLPAWTEEDDAASRGVFDQRPALLIHQAGQVQPQVVAQAWPILQVHSVVEQIVHGQAVKF